MDMSEKHQNGRPTAKWEGKSRHADLSLEALNANKKFNDAIKNCIKLTD